MKKLNCYLYFIHETIADLRITNFMEFPNDAVALKSFLAFLQDKKGEEHYYTLCKACEIDVCDCVHEINKPVCNGDEAEIMLKKAIQDLTEINEENE